MDRNVDLQDRKYLYRLQLKKEEKREKEWF